MRCPAKQPSRPSLLQSLLVGVLVFSAAPLPLTAQSSDTPIKVRGGAMTFFSQGTWSSKSKTSKSFCTTLDPKDVTVVKVERFFDNEDRKDGALTLASPTWRIELRGHEEREGAHLTPSQNGIVMQASPLDCSDKQTGMASVRISPLGSGGFYPSDLPHVGRYHGDRRFASTCTKDRDRCERIAQIKVFDTDPTKPKHTFRCPDGECTLLIGNE